jgi:hypothetical protein
MVECVHNFYISSILACGCKYALITLMSQQASLTRYPVPSSSAGNS